MQAPRFKAGDAVIAAADCFLSLEPVRSRFDPFAVMDFCAGIDTAVLHDRLYTFGLPEPADNPVPEALIDEGVLVDLADTGLMRLQSEAMLMHPMAQPVIKLLLAIRADAILRNQPGVKAEDDGYRYLESQLRRSRSVDQ
jgi:hypothetical protein